MSIDDELLRRIDDEAKKEGLSRSRFLARAAAQILGEEIGPGASPRVHEAIAQLREQFRRNGFPEDSAAAIRAERDARTDLTRQW